ncbi:MAG: DNA topology modulation protein FlaR [Pseudonocardiaceae bacterium]
MERIAIIGCGGSGKSHLARQLAERFELPITHLDAVYYDDDWTTLPKEKFTAIQEELVAQPRWIIEGNYASTLPLRLKAADTVIVLDLPARTCLRGILQRRLKHGGGQHRAIGVYDRINWGFIRYILGYRRSMLPRVHRLIAEHGPTAELVVLRRRRATHRFLDGLPQPVK